MTAGATGCLAAAGTAALAAAATGWEAATTGAATEDAADAGAPALAALPSPGPGALAAGVLEAATFGESGVAELATTAGAGAGTDRPEGAGAAMPTVTGGGLVAGADPGAAFNLFRSAMFLDNSAMRLAAALASLSLAIFSSLAEAGLPRTWPLERVSLSGAAPAGVRSSTLACTLPPAWRSAPSICVAGALPASFRRKALKSLLWARMVWLASLAEIALAACAPGISSRAPDLTRLTLPPMKASGLLRSSATSIWSSDTPAGLFCAAILPAVSPLFTVSCFSPAGILSGAGTLATGARTGGEGRATVAAAGGE